VQSLQPHVFGGTCREGKNLLLPSGVINWDSELKFKYNRLARKKLYKFFKYKLQIMGTTYKEMKAKKC
jgi:hypothetical protein